MKRLLSIILILFYLAASGQSDNPASYIWYKYIYGIRYDRGWFDKSIHVPRDTIYTKSGLAIKGSTLFYGDSTRWYPASSGGVTPGIDDVLAIGQQLTANRLIDGGGFSLQVDNMNSILLDVTSGGRLLLSNPYSAYLSSGIAAGPHESYLQVTKDSAILKGDGGAINIPSLRASDSGDDIVTWSSNGKLGHASFSGNNGVTRSGNNYQLGQLVGASGNPAAFIGGFGVDREIPMGNSYLYFNNKTGTFGTSNPSSIWIKPINDPEIRFHGNSGGGIGIYMDNPVASGAFPAITWYSRGEVLEAFQGMHWVANAGFNDNKHFDLIDMRDSIYSAQIQRNGVAVAYFRNDGASCISCSGTVMRATIGSNANPSNTLFVSGSFRNSDSVLHTNIVRLTDTTGFDVALLDRSTGNMKKMYPNVFGSFASVNIFNSDGSLTGNRTVTLGADQLYITSGLTNDAFLKLSPAVSTSLMQVQDGTASTSFELYGVTGDDAHFFLTSNDGASSASIYGDGQTGVITATGYLISDGGFTASYPDNASSSKSYLEVSSESTNRYSLMYATNGGSNISSVKSYSDSLLFKSTTGYFRFFDLLSTIDTTTYKPAVFDVNGKMRRGNSWAQFSASSGTVTSVSFTGGLISVGTPTTTPAFTVAGTSGGIPYFSSTSTWASSALLAANALMIGGGAGTAPSTTTTGTGILTFLGTPSSANLASAVTDETGSGVLVFGTTPTFTTSIIDPLVIGSTSANGTLTLTGNNSSSSNTGSNGNVLIKVGNSSGITAATFLNTGALIIGAPTADANQAVVIQSLTNTASDGVKIYALNNTASMKLGYQTILTSGALVLNPSSTGAEIAAPSGTGLSISTTAIAPTSTLTVDGSFGVKYAAKTTTYTITATDFTIDATSGTFTATLPTAVGITGRCYFATNSGSGVLTLATASSQTFANQSGTPTTITINQFGGVMVQSNGANWIVLSKF